MEPGALFSPFPLGPVTLRNRLVKAATFEGMSGHGLVSDELVEFHRRHAAGGVAATTLAYCAVSADGRTYRHQLWARPDLRPGLERLAGAVHGGGAALAVQLGHAGWFANPRASGHPSIGPSRKFSPYGLTFSRQMTATDLDRVTDDFRAAAHLVVDSGADIVELHLGHGYLLSQFLSPWTNRRSDEHGGSLADRARFPRRVVAAVRDAVGTSAAVTAKLNMADGFRGGLTLEEGVRVARWLDDDGGLDAIQLTGGFTARTPMYLMRGDVPLREMLANERNTLRRWGLRIVGRRLMAGWPFEEAYFLPMARRVKAEVGLPLMLLGGVTERATAEAALGEGFPLVAMARALLRDPDLPRRWESGEQATAGCTHCNRCVVEMEIDGTRCVLPPAQPSLAADR